MKTPVYDPGLRDASWRDLLARGVTVLLWLVLFWLCRGIVSGLLMRLGWELPLAVDPSAGAARGVLAIMLKLMGFAYMISLVLFCWHAVSGSSGKAAIEGKGELSTELVCEIFHLSLDEVQRMRASKTLSVDVDEEGFVTICEGTPSE